MHSLRNNLVKLKRFQTTLLTDAKWITFANVKDDVGANATIILARHATNLSNLTHAYWPNRIRRTSTRTLFANHANAEP